MKCRFDLYLTYDEVQVQLYKFFIRMIGHLEIIKFANHHYQDMLSIQNVFHLLDQLLMKPDLRNENWQPCITLILVNLTLHLYHN